MSDIGRLPAEPSTPFEAVLRRLDVAGLGKPDLKRRIVADLGSRIETLPLGTILQHQGEPSRRPRLLLCGWASHYRDLPDGRQQVFDFVLPGESLATMPRLGGTADIGTFAQTAVRTVDVAGLIDPGSLHACPDFAAAFRAMADADQHRRLDQIVRLGRLTALERAAHLLLELHDRLAVVGLARDGRYRLPLTQNVLSDNLGLSVVHMNRTLQELKRSGLIEVHRGGAWIRDRARTEQLAAYPSADAQIARADAI